MKQLSLILALGFTLLLAANSLRSQNIIAPAATIQHLLCHKWVVSYALMGNTKLDDPGEQTDLNSKKLLLQNVTFKSYQSFNPVNHGSDNFPHRTLTSV